MMTFDFTGRNVLVTGASSGIGKAVARLFAQGGARVVVHYGSNQAGIDDLLAELQPQRSAVKAVQANLATRAGVEQLFAESRAFLGEQLDVLVNNAGSLLERRPVAEMDEALWDEVQNLNLKSVFLCCQLAIPLLRRSAAGRIINLTSVAARHGGGPGAGAYAAAKAGVLTLTKNLAKELAPNAITVNSVSPGVIATPFHDKFTKPDVRAAVEQTIPLKREGLPDEVAYSILFLASDYAGYITGETLEINGGLYMD